jgi:hypothetical protein
MCGCGKADVSRLFQARGDSYRIGWLYGTILQAVRLRDLTIFLRLRNKFTAIQNKVFDVADCARDIGCGIGLPAARSNATAGKPLLRKS